jgi:hypothetical protein
LKKLQFKTTLKDLENQYLGSFLFFWEGFLASQAFWLLRLFEFLDFLASQFGVVVLKQFEYIIYQIFL